MTSENSRLAITNSPVTSSSYKKEVVLPTIQETYFVNHIDIFTDEFEILRKKSITVRLRRWLTGIFMFSGFIIVCLWQNALLAYAIPLAYVIVFLSFRVFFQWIDVPIYRYNKKVKSKVFPVIFKYFGDDFIYSQTSPWSIKKLKGFNILPFYDTERMYNYVRGTYNNIEIEMVEMGLIQENRESSSIVFKGILLLLTLKKPFSGRVIVIRDERSIKGVRDMQVVHLEDPEFSKAFNVYADDQIEARVLLTTSFMQRLLALGKLIGSKQVDCSFHSGKLLIRVPTNHNYFQVKPFFQTVNFRHEFKTITDDIQIIFDIVDGLQLDLDIGL